MILTTTFNSRNPGDQLSGFKAFYGIEQNLKHIIVLSNNLSSQLVMPRDNLRIKSWCKERQIRILGDSQNAFLGPKLKQWGYQATYNFEVIRHTEGKCYPC